jgi:site-specific DNA-methyltransferase (adenine-specific)
MSLRTRIHHTDFPQKVNSPLKPYYEHAGITIFHGDSREVLPFLKVGMVVTDPPYGTQNLAGGYGRRQLHSPGGKLGRIIQGDQDLSVLESAYRPMVSAIENGWAFVFFAARRLPEFAALCSAEWFGELVWDGAAPGLGYTIRYQHESIAALRIGSPPTPDRALISVMRHYGEGTNDHPHQKPLGLLKSLIRFGTGVVLDPFMGSGTTLRAAKDLGREAIGIEIEERYCEIAAERLRQEVISFENENERIDDECRPQLPLLNPGPDGPTL